MCAPRLNEEMKYRSYEIYQAVSSQAQSDKPGEEEGGKEKN